MASPHSNGPRPFADAFTAYWDAGWRGIIPVVGKHPPQTGYTGTDGLWPSYPDLQTWADGPEGGRNIALRLPDGVLGIDVDQYQNKHGGSTLAQCEATWGPLPPTWRSTSRDDGVSGIRLYRVPQGLAWPGQLPGGDVELIQKTHRYAVVWPSMHPEGRLYRWISREGTVSLNQVPAVDVLPKLPPDWITNLMRGPERREDRAELGGPVMDWLDKLPGYGADPCGWAIRCTREILNLLGGGTMARHDVLVAPLLNLIREFEKGHPGALAALTEVQDRFIRLVTDDGTRSTSAAASEFRRAVEGAARRIQADRTWPPPKGDPCLAGTPAPAGDRAAAASTGPQGPTPWQDAGHDQAKTPEQLLAERVTWLRADKEARLILKAEDAPPPEQIPGPISLTEGLQAPEEAVPYRLGGLLPIGARVLLSAQAKTGKTTLVGNLVRTLVDGGPFLGRYALDRPVTGSVVLIDTEMNRLQLLRWLREQGIDNTDQVQLITLLGKAHTFDLRIPKLMEYWVAELVRVKAEVLIIDPLKPILDSLALSERADTGLITTPLTALKEAAGVSELILTHHSGHNGERARGDSSLRGWPEVEWGLMLTRPEDGTEPDPTGPRFFKAFGRDVQVDESKLNYDDQRRHLIFEGGTRSQVRHTTAAVNIDQTVIEVVRSAPGLGFNRLKAALNEEGIKVGNVRLAAVLDGLVTRLILFRETAGRGAAQHYSVNERLFSGSVSDYSLAASEPLFRDPVGGGAVTPEQQQTNDNTHDDQGPADE